MAKSHMIDFDPDGTTRFIYDDQLQPLIDADISTIRRASHVDPGDSAKGQDPSLWYADLSLSSGPVLSGQPTRALALASEIEWLRTNVLNCACGELGCRPSK